MSYGTNLYGELLYSDSPASTTPTNSSSKKLMDYLPDYWWEIRDMVELQNTIEKEVGTLHASIEDVLKQCYVSTATWGLTQWEQEFGLSTDPSMSEQWRREIVLAQIRGHGTVTKDNLIDAASAFSGGDVEVIEYPDEYRFVIRFVGFLGIPPNMPGFISMLEKMKPAHLSYSFEYIFTTWDMLNHLTWQNTNTMTWSQLKTYGGA